MHRMTTTRRLTITALAGLATIGLGTGTANASTVQHDATSKVVKVEKSSWSKNEAKIAILLRPDPYRR
jgi:hypothetical protein